MRPVEFTKPFGPEAAANLLERQSMNPIRVAGVFSKLATCAALAS